jgi:hypothetical protein
MVLNVRVSMGKRGKLCVVVVVSTLLACGLTPKVVRTPNLTPLVLPPKWTESTDIEKTPSPGWKVFTGVGVELWLPDSFEGGDPVERREELIEMVRSLGPEYESYIRAVEESPTGMVLVAFDLDTLGTIVGVTKREIPPEIPLDEYIVGLSDAFVSEIPGTSVIERSIVQLDRFEAGRIVLEFVTGEAVSRQLTYIVLDEGLVWTVSFASPLDQYAPLVPVFEESISSFQYES